MTADKEPRYGLKLDRLLRIREIDTLGDLVLPIFSIDPLRADVTNLLLQTSDPVSAYAAALEQASPRLRQEVEACCGPAPWIVRSAGDEDFTDDINAGGYDSLICLTPEELMSRVAAVALSGYTDHARRQQALSKQMAYVQAITAFVQPLLKIGVARDVGPSQSPYLDLAVLERIEAVCDSLLDTFDFDAIDCEWGLETTLGFVSMTTIMPRDRNVMNVAHTFGFGFASAQNTGSRATTLALRPASTNLTLWRGRHLRESPVSRLHLLQARPANIEPAFRERSVLTDDCYDALARHYQVADAALLILGAESFGHALIASDMMSAWRQYLALDTPARAAVSVVIVEEGSAEEHAGIMFRQQKMTCVKMDTRHVPPGADCVVFDRATCIFGDSTLLRSVRTERRQELVIPDECALVFTGEVLDFTGELKRNSAEAMSALSRLPLAKEVKERVLALSEQPTGTRWLHRLDGSVESPSLLAQIGRSRHSKGEGGLDTETPFARAYERAVGVSRGDSRTQLPTLHALSPHVRSLAESADLRLVIALLDYEAAAFWVPRNTISSLLQSAAEQLARQQRDNAAFVLSTLSLISAETERLPVYDPHETASNLNVLAQAFERGLSPEGMASIYSLGLPIPSTVELADGAQRHPSVLEPINAFVRAMTVFRGIASSGDDAVRLSRQLNDAYVYVRNALREADLARVGEQLRASVIESYDASLKAMLARVVETVDAVGYQRYIGVMLEWIGLLTLEPLSEGDDIVLQRFQVWLRQWGGEAIPQSFEIKDRAWRYEFDAIARARERASRYENPHVVHNLLHQWSLAGLHLDTGRLPRRVLALARFCSTFSNRSTKILRFERELLEIQIPMGTHKASYVLTPHQIAVEWAEPPDCPDEEIARIRAFEVILDRFRLWMFPGLTSRRERVLGTWTLFIRLGNRAPNVWRHHDFTRVIAATRFLFDASYDFSYVENGAVDGFAERFDGPHWQSVIATWVSYRTLLDDASQYVALHTSPMSSAVSAIARSRVVRGLILRCLRGGIDSCWVLIDRYARWLTMPTERDDRWRDRYEYLRQASLFLAARWPRAALAGLLCRDAFHIGHDLVAACLFKRSDLDGELRQVMASAGTALFGVSALITRHAPRIAVAVRGAEALAAQLADTGVRFRRAKHFLVAHFSDRIDPRVLGRLLEGMDTVPRGLTVATEQVIQAQLSARGKPTCRFDLERGVDWTALEAVRA